MQQASAHPVQWRTMSAFTREPSSNSMLPSSCALVTCAGKHAYTTQVYVHTQVRTASARSEVLYPHLPIGSRRDEKLPGNQKPPSAQKQCACHHERKGKVNSTASVQPGTCRAHTVLPYHTVMSYRTDLSYHTVLVLPWGGTRGWASAQPAAGGPSPAPSRATSCARSGPPWTPPWRCRPRWKQPPAAPPPGEEGRTKVLLCTVLHCAVLLPTGASPQQHHHQGRVGAEREQGGEARCGGNRRDVPGTTTGTATVLYCSVRFCSLLEAAPSTTTTTWGKEEEQGGEPRC